MDGRRAKKLNQAHATYGECVLYVMSHEQRVQDNEALALAQHHALTHNLPLVVACILYPATLQMCSVASQFMIEGLQHVEKDLQVLHIPFIVTTGSFESQMNRLCHELKPCMIIFDYSPLRGPRQSKQRFAATGSIPCMVVDARNIVPVWYASDHQEWAAYTLRPKLHRALPQFLTLPPPIIKHPHHITRLLPKFDWHLLKQRAIKRLPTTRITSGERAAHTRLAQFISSDLAHYDQRRNDPTQNGQSGLSVYIHFGQISPRRILYEVLKMYPHQLDGNRELTQNSSANAFLEELLVRRELAQNFCHYDDSYDSFDGLQDWAKTTLSQHASDPREHTYSYDEFEQARTHDSAWNAAQKQLITTGSMHGYMRMYWAKKILEWTPNAQTAIRIAIKLNDTYQLDGRDPNGYVGILWSIGGLHDRPWFKRPVFGTVRYMNAAGLKRKFDVAKYIKWYDNDDE